MKCKEWILRLVEVEEMYSVSDSKHVTGFLSDGHFCNVLLLCTQQSKKQAPSNKACNMQSKIQSLESMK